MVHTALDGTVSVFKAVSHTLQAFSQTLVIAVDVLAILSYYLPGHASSLLQLDKMYIDKVQDILASLIQVIDQLKWLKVCLLAFSTDASSSTIMVV